MNFQSSNRPRSTGVSPVVAVILLVAVTVGLSAVVGAFTLNLGQQTTSGSAQSDIGITTSHANGNVTATVVTGSADKVKLLVNGTEQSSITNASAGDTVSASAPVGSDVTIVTVTDGEAHVVASQTVSSSSGSTSSGPTLVTVSDTFNDNAFNTSKWVALEPGNATVTEENGVLKLEGGGYSDERPYLRTEEKVNNGTHGNNVTVTAHARVLDAGGTDGSQFYITPVWDGELNNSNYASPSDGIAAGYYAASGEFQIWKYENGSATKIANKSYTTDTNFHNYTVEVTGTHASMDIVLKYDGTTVLTATNVTINNADPMPYVGYSAREIHNGSHINNTTLTAER